MKAILRQLDRELLKREGEVGALRAVRNALAALVPGHPYGRPKLTVKSLAKPRMKTHWLMTPEGKARMSKMMKRRWKLKRAQKA